MCLALACLLSKEDLETSKHLENFCNKNCNKVPRGAIICQKKAFTVIKSYHMLIESLKVNNGCQKVSLSPNHLPKSCSEELQSFSLFLTGAWATLSHSLSEEEVALSN